MQGVVPLASETRYIRTARVPCVLAVIFVPSFHDRLFHLLSVITSKLSKIGPDWYWCVFEDFVYSKVHAGELN